MQLDGVVILHGICRTNRSMAGFARYIKDQGFDTLNIGYPSTRFAIKEIVELIHPRIDNFSQGITGNIHFVGYSMGGLIIRAYLHRYRPPALKRVVMIGTPNQGSEVADFVKDWRLYKRFYGPAGQQLVTDAVHLGDSVDYELGIIAGTLSLTPLGSLIIAHASDGTVSVESTKLAGMKEHITIPIPHTLFPYSRKAWQFTSHFLKHGQFGRN